MSRGFYFRGGVMKDLFVFVTCFVVVAIVYLVIFLVKLKKKDLANSKEVKYLCLKYKIKLKDINLKRLWPFIILANSLIISASGTLCTMLDFGYVWQLLFGFGLLFVLIYLVYGLIGMILKKVIEKRNRK